MSDRNPGNQAGICGLNLYSEFRILRYIYGHKMEYVSLMRVRVPRTKHKEKGIPGWYSFQLVSYIGG